MSRWTRADEPVLEALATALYADGPEARAAAATLVGRHRPSYALGIVEQVTATLTIIRAHPATT